MVGSVHIKRSSGTWSSGYFWFLASFQASKLLTAHFVVLSVFAGVTPLDRAATCLSVTIAAKRVELELRDSLKVPVRYRPNAASGGWSYGRDLAHYRKRHLLLNIHKTT